MARDQTRYVCQSCGAVHPKWGGKCEDCGAWNTLIEEAVRTAPKGLGGSKGKLSFVSLEGAHVSPPRRISGMA